MTDHVTLLKKAIEVSEAAKKKWQHTFWRLVSGS